MSAQGRLLAILRVPADWGCGDMALHLLFVEALSG
jgi:hypothetical protein